MAEASNIVRNTDPTAVKQEIQQMINIVMGTPFGKAVIIIQEDDDESPYVALHNAMAQANYKIQVLKPPNKDSYELEINGSIVARGVFPNIQEAKKSLALIGVERLKESCFFITKKKCNINVTKETLVTLLRIQRHLYESPIPRFTANAGHGLPMNFSWSCGGLGAQAQGSSHRLPVFEFVNYRPMEPLQLLMSLNKLFIQFCNTSPLNVLVFDYNFTQDERIVIHNVSRQFNLKSKSSGVVYKTVTVTKKLTRFEMVEELFKAGGEDGIYKLFIPNMFSKLPQWQQSSN